MANLNKVMLIGRLTRDPEVRTFANGGKVAKLGFAVNNRRKNTATGQWEDEPVFIDLEVFNRGENGRQADLVESSLRKGQQVFIEGHLKMDSWVGKEDGQKKTRILVVVDNFQFLEPRAEGTGATAPRASAPAPRRASAPAPMSGGYDEPDVVDPSGGQGADEDIPF